MNAKLCKQLRKVTKNFRERSYIQDKKQGIPNLELPAPPVGCHYQFPGPMLVVNTIRLHPTCGRKMYRFLKQRAKERMTVVA